jgi:hypothetical protein
VCFYGGGIEVEERQFFRRRLESNEQILWTGRPQQGLLVTLEDLFSLTGFLFAFCILLLGLLSLLGSPAPAKFLFILVPALFIGVIGKEYLSRIFSRTRTYYAVTNERALIYDGFSSTEIQSLDLHTLPKIKLQMHSDGRGTITFGSSSIRLMFAPRGSITPPPCFEVIENAREVYNLIQRAQSGLS